jgi:hypothetical protein
MPHQGGQDGTRQDGEHLLMTKLTFYNLGNADTCLIDLPSGKKMLVDHANVRNPFDKYDLRIGLKTALEDDLRRARRDYYDIVAFTHIDDDHVCGSSRFFWLEHAAKYQGPGRKKIRQLWVPAAAITEEGCEDEGRIIRAEARHRLKQGSGILVFSRPERLNSWLEANGLTLGSRRHLIIDAGQLVPGYTKEGIEAVEFFVHSPHARRMDNGGVEDRNADSLVFQATFRVGGRDTKALFAADITHEVWADIVHITRSKGRAERLEWDVFKLPHHCSYTAIGPEKGEDQTEPTGQVAWLCEQQGRRFGVAVSSSKPIPEKGTAEDRDKQPPHRQAANYYKGAFAGHDIRFKVMMEHPTRIRPKPLEVEIGGSGATIVLAASVGSAAITSGPAPRAGRR